MDGYCLLRESYLRFENVGVVADQAPTTSNELILSKFCRAAIICVHIIVIGMA
jgi:hypothetical protein